MSSASTSPSAKRLAEKIPAPLLTACCDRLALLTGDVEAALVNGERWVETYQAEQGAMPDLVSELDWLLPAWASGSFLPRLLVRRPWLFDRFRNSPYASQSKPAPEFLRELLERTENLTDADQLAAALREFKSEEIFSIGARDLAGRLHVVDVVAELSYLASSCIEAAYRFHRRRMAADYGEPMVAGVPSRFAVIGMGKLGGFELNFSSDIDLIYLYEDDGDTAGGRLGSITNGEFFHKMSIKMTAALNDVTDDGFVFRVDLRLRPEGNSGPLVNTVGAAENYYLSYGQTWERAAMLKARPVAGDLELGDQFLATLSNFVYRRHLDYTTVEDIKLMKQKIDVSLARSIKNAWDVKLGSGGIREIEFIVQTMLLVHAGKQKSLRTRSTLEGLRRLEGLNLLQPGDAALLTASYEFLRRLEHRLQIEHERQTQRLAESPEAQLRMARLLGYNAKSADEAVSAFREDLARHRENVQMLYRRLFDLPGEELTKDIHPAILAVTDPEGSDEDRLKALSGLGFSSPIESLASMRRLVEAPHTRNLDSKGRRIRERIMPLFLSQCIAAPDPDMALKHLEDFMHRVGEWKSYHSLLAENPETLKLLVRFFGSSSFLSRFFIQHPELLDQLVLATYVTPLKDYARIEADLGEALADAEDDEERLDVLRHFKNSELLRIAINDIDGQLDVVEVTSQLADLADAILRAATAMALQAVEQRFGKTAGAELVTLGMGKFGGREMNYSSDLDLIFIYTGEGMTDGEKSVTLPEFFGKAIQRLISSLTVATREGIAYPIDTRLRPSGNSGPLVTSLQGFETYHRTAAAIWERQALIKARPIAGSEASAGHIQAVLHHAIYERPFGPDETAEILRLRKRMETEIDPETPERFNIKTGPGGIVDIEFFVQIMQLRNGGEYHSLRTPNTFLALAELVELHLIESEDYQALREGYLFLRRLENRMRILQDSAKSVLSKDPVAAERLALSMGFERGAERGDAGKALLRQYLATRGNIRRVFDRHFEKERPAK